VDDDERVWFRERIFGYGYGPASWEGWLVTVLFLAVFVGTVKLAVRLIHYYSLSPNWNFAIIPLLIVYLFVFLRIIYTHRGPA